MHLCSKYILGNGGILCDDFFGENTIESILSNTMFSIEIYQCFQKSLAGRVLAFSLLGKQPKLSSS